MKYLIYCDGGARGNPGPAAIGIVIKNEHKEVVSEFGRIIGVATNNQAEYQAVLAAIKWLRENGQPPIEAEFCLDSQLIVEQLNGNYKVKNLALKMWYNKVRELIMVLGGRVVFQAIPRAENHQADKLVNLALDKELL